MANGSPPLVLDNPIQNYAWGSRTALAELLGRPNAERPTGSGAVDRGPPQGRLPHRHPGGPGHPGGGDRERPGGTPGAEVCEHFGNELPFLLKILAAAEPLSIQAHPDHEQARRGWARQNAEGIPVDAPRRSYRDQNHKPELVCALTPFTALKGFRASSEVARRIEPIAGSELDREVARLGRERTPAALRALFTRLMTLESDEKEAVLSRGLEESARQGPDDDAWAWVETLHSKYPGDIGSLSPLYLNLLTLAPEEALYLRAGEMHAYLEGTAIEIMANSDNILRGGLTPKTVDLPELLAILTFDTREPRILRGESEGPAQRVYRTEAREFELSLVQVEEDTPFTPEPGRGVEILLALEGACAVRVDDEIEQGLGKGQAIFVPATLRSYTVEGTGRLARAVVPA